MASTTKRVKVQYVVKHNSMLAPNSLQTEEIEFETQETVLDESVQKICPHCDTPTKLATVDTKLGNPIVCPACGIIGYVPN
jgi:predicted RNA-binding Zn-ribbon protein involved in translation (DUF1610 family)